MGSEIERIKRIKLDKADQVTQVLRNREFDYYARDFLARFPKSVVVHIGCGLDVHFFFWFPRSLMLCENEKPPDVAAAFAATPGFSHL